MLSINECLIFRSEIRTSIEKHTKNTYLKKVQAPIGAHAILKAWMELG